VTDRRSALLVIGLGLLGSQAGHLLAYQLMFGARAQQLQSTGPHAYFPLVVKTTLGAAVVALIGCLVIIGLARFLSGKSVRSTSEASYLSLLAFLFSIQLTAFAAQEVGEAMAAGVPIPSVAQLLLWGALGQLPVAVMAALALRWLCTRVEAAVGAIRDVVEAGAPAGPAFAPVAFSVLAAPDRAVLLSRIAGASLAKRGPPLSMLIA
jgi:hypothetical protein